MVDNQKKDGKLRRFILAWWLRGAFCVLLPIVLAVCVAYWLMENEGISKTAWFSSFLASTMGVLVSMVVIYFSSFHRHSFACQSKELRQLRDEMEKYREQIEKYNTQAEACVTETQLESLLNFVQARDCQQAISSDPENASADNISSLCTSEQDKELMRYADGLRLRNKLQIGEMFPNENRKYATIIVKEFLRLAKKHVNIFCGRLNENVYSRLYDDFIRAIEHNVKVRVITCVPFENIHSKKLANVLANKGLLRYDDTLASTPHFIEVDGEMFRLETDQEKGTAVVCAFAPANKYNQEIVQRLNTTYEVMWQNAAKPKTKAHEKCGDEVNV